MFAFRPVYFDPWASGGPWGATYVPPYGEAFAPSSMPSCNCQACVADARDAFIDEFRPRVRSHQFRHPSPAHHPQAHLLYHPELLHMRGHPGSAYANTKAQASPAYDTDPVLDAQAEPVAHDGYPWPPCHSSRPSSSHASLHSGSYPFSPAAHEPMYECSYSREPSPFAAATRQQQQQAHRRQQCQQQAGPGPGAAAPAAHRGRHNIPVQVAHTATACQPSAEHVPVHHGPASAAAAQAHPQHPQQQQQPRTPLRPARQLTRAEAAVVIQSIWRMRRLARQYPALQALAAASAQLRSASSLFESFKAESSAAAGSSSSDMSGTPHQQQQQQRHQPVSHLSHKQYLELNELAMRVLLQLDATSCGVAELRAVRKRLTAATIKLLDEIQACHSAAVNASMELSDDVVRAAVQGMAKAADDAAAAAPVSTQQQQVVEAQRTEEHFEQVQQLGVQPDLEQQQAGQQQLNEQQDQAEGEGEPGEEEVTAITAADAADDHFTGLPAGENMVAEASSDSGAAMQEVAMCEEQQQEVHLHEAQEAAAAASAQLPPGVRVVFVYPGSRVDAATQTD